MFVNASSSSVSSSLRVGGLLLPHGQYHDVQRQNSPQQQLHIPSGPQSQDQYFDHSVLSSAATPTVFVSSSGETSGQKRNGCVMVICDSLRQFGWWSV